MSRKKKSQPVKPKQKKNKPKQEEANVPGKQKKEKGANVAPKKKKGGSVLGKQKIKKKRKTTLLRKSNWRYFCHYNIFPVLFQFSPPFWNR